MLAVPIREFRLSPSGYGRGISCDASGAFIDSIPLLKRSLDNAWIPRDAAELSDALGAHYGLPIDISSKTAGLDAIARALNAGDITHAQLVTLHLQIPETPQLAKSAEPHEDAISFIRGLDAGNLLQKVWQPDDHPRWPAGSPDKQEGEFEPKDDAGGETFLESDKGSDRSGYVQVAADGIRPQRSWEDYARETHTKPVWGIPSPIDPPFLDLDEAEVAVQVGATPFLKPGPFAEEWVPATGPNVTASQRARINKIGSKSGCHTCGIKVPGTRRGNWVTDHQPSSGLNPLGNQQRLYPQCLKCSLRQGGFVNWLLRLRRSQSQ